MVLVKTLGAGTASLMLAWRRCWATGGRRPAMLAPALLLGAVSYGASLLLDMYALRLLGAAREAAYFATAPFIGALLALPVLGEAPGRRELGGGRADGRRRGPAGRASATATCTPTMPLEHEHLHMHDEHHQHTHDGPAPHRAPRPPPPPRPHHPRPPPPAGSAPPAPPLDVRNGNGPPPRQRQTGDGLDRPRGLSPDA